MTTEEKLIALADEVVNLAGFVGPKAALVAKALKLVLTKHCCSCGYHDELDALVKELGE